MLAHVAPVEVAELVCGSIDALLERCLDREPRPYDLVMGAVGWAIGRLVDHASDALGPLRRGLAAIKAQLEKRMGALLTDERFSPYLQDAYYTQREDRYVLPVRTDGMGFVRGIVHGTSQSGQTLFIEPGEIVDLNNRAKLAEAEVLDEERRILAKFSGWVAEEAAAFDAALAAAEILDVIASAAVIADDTVAAEPIIDDAPPQDPTTLIGKNGEAGPRAHRHRRSCCAPSSKLRTTDGPQPRSTCVSRVTAPGQCATSPVRDHAPKAPADLGTSRSAMLCADLNSRTS